MLHVRGQQQQQPQAASAERLMMNSSRYFHLTAYLDAGVSSYLLFVLLLIFYLLIVGSNLLLTAVISLSSSLHQPMYLLLCSLFVNELFGSTALLPFLMLQILSDLHVISVPFCFLQIFWVHQYGSVEFFSLAVMSFDRYLAICRPLQYRRLMSCRRAVLLATFAWIYSLLATAAMMSLSAPLQLCGNLIHKVYCDNYSIVKLSCSDTTVNNVYGLGYLFTVVLALIALIVCSYLRILLVCSSGCRRQRLKAVRTCSPHLASLLNFSCGCFFEVVQSRFDMTHLPPVLRVFLSLYWLLCQPLFNPLVYGLSLAHIRRRCSRLTAHKHH